MAVQILNDMPDAEVHRGEPTPSLTLVRSLPPRPIKHAHVRGRAKFIVITAALHVLVFAGFVSAGRIDNVFKDPEPMLASIVESPPRPKRSRPRSRRRFRKSSIPCRCRRNLVRDGEHHAAGRRADFDLAARFASRRAAGRRVHRVRAGADPRVSDTSRAASANAAPWCCACSWTRRASRANPDRAFERLRTSGRRGARRRTEGAVPSARSRWPRAACASPHPHRVHSPRELNAAARMMRASGPLLSNWT